MHVMLIQSEGVPFLSLAALAAIILGEEDGATADDAITVLSTHFRDRIIETIRSQDIVSTDLLYDEQLLCML